MRQTLRNLLFKMGRSTTVARMLTPALQGRLYDRFMYRQRFSTCSGGSIVALLEMLSDEIALLIQSLDKKEGDIY
jgi:hypothetical protein